MRTSRFTPERMILALRQAEGGTAIEEVCRSLGQVPPAEFRRRGRFRPSLERLQNSHAG